MRRHRMDRGGVLILAVWLLVFFTVIAVSSAIQTQQHIRVMKTAEGRIALYDTAFSGLAYIQDIVQTLPMRDSSPETHSLNDFWANDPHLFRAMKYGEGTASFLTPGEQGVLPLCYGLVDEESKLNINSASAAMIARLIAAQSPVDAGMVETITQNIIDWRDTDDVFRSDNDEYTEKDYYRDQGYDYTPRNAPFVTSEELLLVDGVTPVLFFALRDYITVYGTGKININTASAGVLCSLGFDKKSVEKIMTYRAGFDGRSGTADDNVFIHPRKIPAIIAAHVDLTPKEEDILQTTVNTGIVSVVSSVFSVHIQARNEYVPMLGHIYGVIDLNGDLLYCGYSLTSGE